MQVLAMSAPGLEPILAGELRRMKINPGRSIAGGVEFSGTMEHVRRANLRSRVASRIVARAGEFHASSFHELERRAKKIEWRRFVAPGTPVRFRVTCRRSRLYHSDAVAARLVEAAGCPASDEDDAQLFVVRIVNDVCTISADSSGALLHRRGYRQAVAKAPVRETLAAAMLAGSGWDPAMPLVDPMCGSGTVAIEAALIARRMAPGLGRRFAFERWADHDAEAWSAMIGAARGEALPAAPAPIIASDRDAGAVEAARWNAARAGVAADVELSVHAVSDAGYPAGAGWIVSNPPYGLRVGESGPLRNLYAQLGRILREQAEGYHIALLSADKALEAQLRIELREVFRVSNGGIPVRLVVGDKGGEVLTPFLAVLPQEPLRRSRSASSISLPKPRQDS